MKRKEFIEQVEKLGVDVKVIKTKDNYLKVFNAENCIAYIKDDELYRLSTGHVHFALIPERVKKSLLTLITDYASTPLEEREEEKKYVITRISDSGNTMYLIHWQTNGNNLWEAFDAHAYNTNSLEKAQALATLVNGKVEEV